MKKFSTVIILMAIFADISSAAYKSWRRTTNSYRSTSSIHTSQSHTQTKKPTHYRAIPSNQPHVVVEKKDNFFWGMFWGAVLFSDHGKTTHITNEIKQQVATENQDLWDEYQQNLEAIKSGGGDVDTLKARNKEILSVFKQKAAEKYIAEFQMDLNETSSALLETKSITGVSDYTDASFSASLLGATHGKPIVETRTYNRYEKVFQVNLVGPKPLNDFKVEAVDPSRAIIERNASGIYVRNKQDFGTYPLDIRFTDKKDKSLSFTRSFATGGGNTGELSPLPNAASAEAAINGMADTFKVNDVGELMSYGIVLMMIFLGIKYLLKESSLFSDNSVKTTPKRTPTDLGDLKQMEINFAKSLNKKGVDDTSSSKTAKISQQYYTNKKYQAGR